jgi:hypothetical protein
MIKAQELRIGNWVLGNNTYQQIEIEQLEYLLNDKFSPHAAIQPISLTPELLEKCGFKKRLSSDKVLYHFFQGENPVTHDWLIDLNWIIGREYPFYKNGYHQIRSLHQLQNLFYCLTGEELNIDL